MPNPKSWTPEYAREWKEAWRKKNREKIRLYDNNKVGEYRANRKIRMLKLRFNLTIEDYLKLSQRQGHVCAICKQEETIVDKRSGTIKALAVDHCHATGKVRGLLCANCNQGLGKFRDNSVYLFNAINYLEEN